MTKMTETVNHRGVRGTEAKKAYAAKLFAGVSAAWEDVRWTIALNAAKRGDTVTLAMVQMSA